MAKKPKKKDTKINHLQQGIREKIDKIFVKETQVCLGANPMAFVDSVYQFLSSYYDLNTALFTKGFTKEEIAEYGKNPSAYLTPIRDEDQCAIWLTNKGFNVPK
jgi:hypothetical protein